jgi:hypothetical protein
VLGVRREDTAICSTSMEVRMKPGVFAFTTPSLRLIIAASRICFVDIRASFIMAFIFMEEEEGWLIDWYK